MKAENVAGKRIGLIGVGNIGASILRGLLAADSDARMERFYIYDAKEEAVRHFESDPGYKTRVEVCENSAEVAKNSEIIIMAVKPNVVKAVVEEIAPFVAEDKILISVAAGVLTETIERYLGEEKKLIRVMPNVGVRVGESVSAICRGKYAGAEDEDRAKAILSVIGSVYSVSENDIDVITGLSGSGIAFFAAVIEAMADGGVYNGLQHDLALTIAAKTALGAAKMVLAGDTPGEIQTMTASPGGTTIRGLYALETGGVKAAMMRAVIDATDRAAELSRMGGRDEE
ncbi:pyrroline-5-carboxylate reductase [Methanophagales archaeon]|nr:MAG: pyrroline-5-carboxylate reductase [Methanophagales archaeon]